MKNWRCCVGWVVLMSWVGMAQAQPVVGMPSPWVPVTIFDPGRSLADAPAIARMKLPRGWQVDVDLYWHEDSACPPDMAQLRLRASAAGGLPALEISPTAAWLVAEEYPQMSGNDIAAAQDDLLTAGCLVVPYGGLEEFLRALAVQLRPQAELLAYRELPQQLQRVRSQLAPAGEKLDSTEGLQAGELLMRYSDQGKLVREVWQASMMLREVEGRGRIAQLDNVYALRMEDSAFDPAMLERIVVDVMPDSQWQTALRTRTAELVQAYDDRVMARLEQAMRAAQERAGKRSPARRFPYGDDEARIEGEQLPMLRDPQQVFAAVSALAVAAGGLMSVQPRLLLLAADDKVRQTMRKKCIGRAFMTANMSYLGADEDSRRQQWECWRRWGREER